MIRSALSSIERFLLPNACIACGALVERSTPDELVCGVCRSRLQVVRGGCNRCHQPLPPVGPCRFCAAWPQELVWVSSAVWLGPEAREMVHHLKYEGYTRLAAVMATTAVRTIPHPGDVLLVPVPLGQRREALRGYNQATMLARALAEAWSVEMRAVLLRRVRETASQADLAPEQRAGNVKGAFSAVRGFRAQDEKRLVILVDDVLTTGATMVAAAAALAESGWEQIGGLTFARAPPYDKRVLLSRPREGTRTDQHSLTPFSRPV